MNTSWQNQISKLLTSITGLVTNQFATIEYGQEKTSEAVSILITNGQPLKFLTEVRTHLPNGFVSYIGASIKQPSIGTELVVGPGANQKDILRLAKTRADNYDQDTADLIAAFEKIRGSASIDIVHADTDSVGFYIVEQPTNHLHFAQLLFEICPDLNQTDDCANINSLIKTLKKEKFITLWWD